MMVLLKDLMVPKPGLESAILLEMVAISAGVPYLRTNLVMETACKT